MMTWNELRAVIDQMTDEQLSASVTVYDASDDEFFGVSTITESTDDEDDESASIIGDDAHYLTFNR